VATADALYEVLTGELEDGNRTFVTDLLEAAKAKIVAGGGEISPLQSATLNGKQFLRTLRMDCVQVAQICRQALAAADGREVSATRLDFSGLNSLS